MKLYTKTVCPKCMWIKSELQRAGVQAEMVNIDHDENAREYLLQAGIMRVPVMEMDGELILDQAEMLERLERVKR